MMPRKYSLLDQFILQIDQTLSSLNASFQAQAKRQNPSAQMPEMTLSAPEKDLSAALMRVNHAGEVCAQALYHGQAFTTKAITVREKLIQAAAEEADHLSWCQQRLTELESHPSYLAPLWYSGSWLIGAFAGLWSDRFGLGFIAETEHQVVAHLDKHLQRLPAEDNKSRQILLAMRKDESQHATTAIEAGATALPVIAKLLMRGTSKVMTTVAYWI